MACIASSASFCSCLPTTTRQWEDRGHAIGSFSVSCPTLSIQRPIFLPSSSSSFLTLQAVNEHWFPFGILKCGMAQFSKRPKSDLPTHMCGQVRYPGFVTVDETHGSGIMESERLRERIVARCRYCRMSRCSRSGATLTSTGGGVCFDSNLLHLDRTDSSSTVGIYEREGEEEPWRRRRGLIDSSVS